MLIYLGYCIREYMRVFIERVYECICIRSVLLILGQYPSDGTRGIVTLCWQTQYIQLKSKKFFDGCFDTYHRYDSISAWTYWLLLQVPGASTWSSLTMKGQGIILELKNSIDLRSIHSYHPESRIQDPVDVPYTVQGTFVRPVNPKAFLLLTHEREDKDTRTYYIHGSTVVSHFDPTSQKPLNNYQIPVSTNPNFPILKYPFIQNHFSNFHFSKLT